MALVVERPASQQHSSISTDDSRLTATSIVVLDPLGEVFNRLRELDLHTALWRILDVRRVTTNLEMSLAVCASYGPVNWDDVIKLTQQAPTLIITTAYRREEAQEAMERDLVGYLDAGMARDALDRALRGALLNGEPGFPRDIIGAWMRARRAEYAQGNSSMNGLTRRQQEIIQLIARGATDKEIAGVLGIAQATAQKHVTNILQRLQVPNRAAAVAVVANQRRAS
jgi:DNA-binding NarL/FixJ family response regulator